MWDMIGAIIAGMAFCVSVFYVRKISKTLSIFEDPDKFSVFVDNLITRAKMSLMGKQSGYVKKKSKMAGLMQDFVIEDLAPDFAEGMIPGIPPVVVKFLAKKLNDSELGDWLRENPEMYPDALSLAGQAMQAFQQAQAGERLDRPASTGQLSDGWQ